MLSYSGRCVWEGSLKLSQNIRMTTTEPHLQRHGDKK